MLHQDLQKFKGLKDKEEINKEFDKIKNKLIRSVVHCKKDALELLNSAATLNGIAKENYQYHDFDSNYYELCGIADTYKNNCSCLTKKYINIRKEREEEFKKMMENIEEEKRRKEWEDDEYIK